MPTSKSPSRSAALPNSRCLSVSRVYGSLFPDLLVVSFASSLFYFNNRYVRTMKRWKNEDIYLWQDEHPVSVSLYTSLYFSGLEAQLHSYIQNFMSN